uniref:Uncharacterized protein LOC105033095 n=1 Tax=Elaeis guineensis var. tenera TaxID=51953 RepID=A0A8N4EQJ1_ELAGV|nr:uncharacterized protein LOC105033095 [Elaeis guineensis]
MPKLLLQYPYQKLPRSFTDILHCQMILALVWSSHPHSAADSFELFCWCISRLSDLEGKTDGKIRALEEVEELRTKRADKQSMLFLDAFNKDRASLPQPLQNSSQLSSTPAPIPPDPRTQEMINEKLRKAEDLGEKGMVDEAQKALEEAEALKMLGARQEPVLDSSKYTAADVLI